MAEHPNVELLRRGFEAFSTGDFDTLRRDIFSEDVVFHVGGNNPLTGDYKGIDEVFGFLGRLVEETGGTFSLDLHDVLANEEHGVALVRASAERQGKRLQDDNNANVFHIDNGRITEVWALAEDTTRFDALFS